MKYAILNWMDGSLDIYATSQDAVLRYREQLDEHKRIKKEENSKDEFDKMVIKILYTYNSID